MEDKAYKRMMNEFELENAMVDLLRKNNFNIPSTIDEMAKIATELKLDSEQMDVLESISFINDDDDSDYDNSDDEIERYNDAFGGGGNNYYYH